MSILPLQHDDVKRSVRETSPNPSDPQTAIATPRIEEQQLQSQDVQQARQTTVADGQFTGRGSIVNEIV